LRDAHQTNRFEFKYLVTERRAAAVRDFVRSYLDPDPYADPEQGNSYFLSSLYLDTADLSLYRQTATGEKNRFKLRIRFYDNDPDSPALLEMKRRVTDTVLKDRAVVTRDGVRRFLRGEGPEASWIMAGDADVRSHKTLIDFCQLCDRVAAGPSIFVSYRREAYASAADNTYRVTFDRQLMGSRCNAGSDLTLPTEGARPDVGNGDQVILELKFSDRFPEWMRDLAHLFNLRRTSVPKYNLCIEALGLRTRAPRTERTNTAI
jgi:hypothetical protein